MNFACWRLPNENKIEWIDENEPNHQEFVIQSFDKSKKSTKIIGSIKEINLENLKPIFAKINLQNRSENTDSITKNDFFKMFEKAKNIFSNNEIEKIVISRFQIIKKEIDLYQTFCKLCLKYPGAFVFFFILQSGQTMIGASPEIILKSNENENLQTEALGGTETKNGFTEKEFIEHNVIINHIETILTKNDLLFHKSDTFKIEAGPLKHPKNNFDIKKK